MRHVRVSCAAVALLFCTAVVFPFFCIVPLVRGHARYRQSCGIPVLHLDTLGVCACGWLASTRWAREGAGGGGGGVAAATLRAWQL